MPNIIQFRLYLTKLLQKQNSSTFLCVVAFEKRLCVSWKVAIQRCFALFKWTTNCSQLLVFGDSMMSCLSRCIHHWTELTWFSFWRTDQWASRVSLLVISWRVRSHTIDVAYSKALLHSAWPLVGSLKTKACQFGSVTFCYGYSAILYWNSFNWGQ